MADIEFEIPPRSPGEDTLRVILTHDQANDLRAAYTTAQRSALLTNWGGTWDIGERERFVDWFTATGGRNE